MFKIDFLKKSVEIVTSEKGNSMIPYIKSGQKHKLKSCTWEHCKVGDIVFCKVKGRLMTHKVWQIHPNKGLLIGNAKGHKNGWTKIVYAKVVEIY